MTMQIAVPEQPVAAGPEMTDKDRLNDIMSFEKYLTTGYCTGLNEMQNPQLHSMVQKLLNDSHTTQFKLFDAMFAKGWYTLNAADQQQIMQTQQQFTGYKNQIPQFQ